MTKLLSIITINYNNAAGLNKTMDSVKAQTWQGFEHIVIDGDSSDNSIDVLKSFNYNNLNWISEPDSGIYNAMNKGIARASGKYLLFLNSGDILINAKVLDSLIDTLRKSSCAFLGCNLVIGFENQNIEKQHPEKISFSYLLTKTVYHPSTFINKKMFDIYGMYNENLQIVADWEFFFKTIGLNGESFMKIPVALTLFDPNGISSTGEYSKEIRQEKSHVINHYLRSFQNSELDKFCLHQMRNPSKRIRYLVEIEKSPILRKISTVFLRLVSIFL